MKGVVFTEFIDMVEATFGLEVADKIIGSSHLASKGAYTSVGTYDYHEMVELVTELSKATDIPVPDLLKAFGNYLFGQFVKRYPAFFTEKQTVFGFLQQVEKHIHVEVRKLYPDAELPTFETSQSSPNQMEMLYSSERKMSDLAEGLILGCIAHFKEQISIAKEDVSGGSGTNVRFILKKQS
jgi:hypothetical protein